MKKEIALNIRFYLKEPMEMRDEYIDKIYEDLNFLGVATGGTSDRNDIYTSISIIVSKPDTDKERAAQELENAVLGCIYKFVPQENISKISKELEVRNYGLKERFYDLKAKYV